MVNPNDFPSLLCYYVAYFVDHAPTWEFRRSLIEQIGCSIGVNIASAESKPKDIIKGKKGEFRMQIAQKKPNFPIVACAIIEDEKKVKHHNALIKKSVGKNN